MGFSRVTRLGTSVLLSLVMAAGLVPTALGASPTDLAPAASAIPGVVNHTATGSTLSECLRAGLPKAFWADCAPQVGLSALAGASVPSPAATTEGKSFIRGRVTGPGGVPLASIEVDAVEADYSAYGYAFTASDGTYAVAVVAGTYTVSFYDGSDTYLHGYYNGAGFTTDHSNATPVSVGTSDVSGIDVQLQTGYHIRGRVTGPGGALLANIDVNASTSGYSYSDYTTTAVDGTYSAHVASGSYSVFFSDTSNTYLNGYYSSSGFALLESAATPVTVGTSDVAGIDVQLQTGNHIRGTVTGTGGMPLAGIEVDANTSDYSYSGYALTASDGTYAVAVPAGSFTLWFRDYMGTWASGEYDLGASGNFSTGYSATPVVVGLADVTGIDVVMPRDGATYVPLTPTRILDSRDGTGGVFGAFSSHVARTFRVTGGAVPDNAIAVTGNLTVTQQTSLGFVYIGPDVADNPTSSTLNFPVGDDRANAVTVALGTGGISTMAEGESPAVWSTFGILSITYAAPTVGPTAHVIFDVTGYFTPDMSGATYVPLTPTRILDSRYGTGGLWGAFSSHVARTFQVTGGLVPVSAIAVTGNLTVTQQTSLGFLSIGPVAADNPTSSTLNFPVGDDRANATTVALGAGGALSITYAAPTLGPTAHVIFDVTGYFTRDMSGATYVPVAPFRVLDSRDGTGGLSGAFTSHVARTFDLYMNAIAVTGNLTVTQQTSQGYLFIGPVAANNPTSSTLNFPVGDDRANGVTVAISGGGTLSITYAAPSMGPTAHVILDVTGYFPYPPAS